MTSKEVEIVFGYVIFPVGWDLREMLTADLPWEILLQEILLP